HARERRATVSAGRAQMGAVEVVLLEPHGRAQRATREVRAGKRTEGALSTRPAAGARSELVADALQAPLGRAPQVSQDRRGALPLRLFAALAGQDRPGAGALSQNLERPCAEPFSAGRVDGRRREPLLR